VVNWLSQNGLALYGALTGTAALLINFFVFRHNLNKDKVKLAVSLTEHPMQESNIRDMEATSEKKSWEQINLTEVFVVTVRNVGNVTAHIDGVGVTTASGREIPALVGGEGGNANILEKANSKNIASMPPQSAKSFSVYLNRGEELYKVFNAYAIDQTGMVWRSNA
jgi:hypothetical protein